MKNLSITSVQNLGKLEAEIIERKGVGHPDTIADALAENLSVVYAQYTLDRFGAILHHNFDKLAVLGGTTEVDFGEGKLINPIRVIINGRASISFANESIPVREILEKETRRFFHEMFSGYCDPLHDIEIHWFVSNSSGPGKTKQSVGSRGNLFTPRAINEAKGYDRLLNNDTSIGCSYAPLSPLEEAVLELEKRLNSNALKKRFPWLGKDIKIMALRKQRQYAMTMCLPQIAMHTPSIDIYKNNIQAAQEFINSTLKEILPDKQVVLYINTRDDFERGDVYLTVIGSSIESGDEGIVGRGNRVNGLITPLRPMNLEGACGKNPKYYTGKLYNIAAKQIAKRLYEATENACEVILVSQAGKPLTDPWSIMVRTSQKNPDHKGITEIVKDEIKQIPNITENLLLRKIQLY
ncbi:MAG: methionine adenosyltransferase [Patescibacteria group bacterium]